MKSKILKNKILGKKGVFMTIIALIITSFLIFIFSAQIENPLNYQEELITSRIDSLNYYSDNFYDYVESATSITGYFALSGVINDIESTKTYNSNFYQQFPNCILYGNLTAAKTCPGMQNKTLSYQIDRYRQLANDELKINTNYVINSINVSQTQDPFLIDVIINLSVQVSDAFANISSNRVISSEISVVGLKDPLYAVDGNYSQRIKKGNITKREGTWAASDIETMYKNKEYRVSSSGVSFIDRIKGNFVNSSFGIESFVNYTNPGVQARINPSSSFVDYLFWRDVYFACYSYEVVKINPSAIPSMPNSPSFQLDDEHRLLFNIANSDTSTTDGCS